MRRALANFLGAIAIGVAYYIALISIQGQCGADIVAGKSYPFRILVIFIAPLLLAFIASLFMRWGSPLEWGVARRIAVSLLNSIVSTVAAVYISGSVACNLGVAACVWP